MAPRYPPTATSNWPGEYKPYAEWIDKEVTPALGANGEVLTYRQADGGLCGPFPVLIASKEVGKKVSEAARNFSTLASIPSDAKEVAILTTGWV